MSAIYAFEDTEGMNLLPLAARRALDHAGQKLSRESWRSLSLDDRSALTEAGALDPVPLDAVRAITARATPAPSPIAPRPDPTEAPPALAGRLAATPWSDLRPLDRFALAHMAASDRDQPIDALLAALAARRPTHLDAQGEARMVDVGAKPVVARRAVASALVSMEPDTYAAIATGGLPKGDAFGVARVAGIQAAKRTHELIPLCHAIALQRVDVRFEPGPAPGDVRIVATADAIDRTGVEMEAMTAASVAALTLYDMVKGMERGVRIGAVQLERKEGGRSGTWQREPTAPRRDEAPSPAPAAPAHDASPSPASPPHGAVHIHDAHHHHGHHHSLHRMEQPYGPAPSAPPVAPVRPGQRPAAPPPAPPAAPPAAPPVVAQVELRSEPLSVESAQAATAHAGAGAIVTFAGAVRDHSEGHAVTRLEYEAYPAMALAEMRRIAEGIGAEVPGVRLAVQHRVGSLVVGDLAVVCVASAPHRGEAFKACRLLIDRIKAQVPIWKREHGPDGAYWVGWRDARCDGHE